MIQFLKQLLRAIAVSFMLVLSRFLPAQDTNDPDITEQLEPEPLREMDEWDFLMHQDDVSPEEIEMLESDDPAIVKQAKLAIEKRQAEFQEVWDDVELRKELFQHAYLKDANIDQEQIPMCERPGWEDDDMPETFTGVDPVTGALTEVRFDELPEWQNINNTQK